MSLVDQALDHYIKDEKSSYTVDKNKIITLINKEIKNNSTSIKVSPVLKKYLKLGVDTTSKKDQGRYCLFEEIKSNIKKRRPELSTSKNMIDFFAYKEKNMKNQK